MTRALRADSAAEFLDSLEKVIRRVGLTRVITGENEPML